MGMFDDLRCKYPLPIAGANAMAYQTKDTPAQYCELYEIREDGTLWHTEDNTDDKRWEPCEMTGEVRFYTGTGPPDDGWLEFSVYFVKGKLLHLETISDGTVDYFGKPVATKEASQP